MDHRDRIISAVAERECRRVCRRVILALQRMPNGSPFDDDIPLQNLWNEVCVQVQVEESVAWGVYVAVMEQAIDAAIERTDLAIRQAIWLRTSDGLAWVPGPEENAAGVPCSRQDIVEYILQEYVLSQAGGYSNARIRKYLRNRS
jgi:hypothetical protein